MISNLKKHALPIALLLALTSLTECKRLNKIFSDPYQAQFCNNFSASNECIDQMNPRYATNLQKEIAAGSVHVNQDWEKFDYDVYFKVGETLCFCLPLPDDYHELSKSTNDDQASRKMKKLKQALLNKKDFGKISFKWSRFPERDFFYKIDRIDIGEDKICGLSQLGSILLAIHRQAGIAKNKLRPADLKNPIDLRVKLMLNPLADRFFPGARTLGLHWQILL